MSNILLLLSSPSGAASLSTKLATSLIETLKQKHPGSSVTVRDLARDQLPHIGEDFVNARGLSADQYSSGQQEVIARSDALIKELFSADILVIASGMINFGVPSTLKAWLDHVLRAGATFSYTESGVKGLVSGKKAYLVNARGGVYSEGAYKPFDFQEPYLKGVLGFIGVTDVEVVTAEGVAYGPDAAEKAIGAAQAKIAAVLQAA
ncbi:FMN-dependent NADH-azoreductase [Undibacterium terreum]|uniref:FMN dependent NADH:quinone oxidoreductase n=1 Tax=Undibacterium terreum TaxID=1224302 RepID=A0A916UF02_9BURK|nr:FMN-dependent NADH-azoreductase [Undibacterium terreum]GGC68573.1 FMN-dependent NADH-azoreductase [Undibacterium terreum]